MLKLCQVKDKVKDNKTQMDLTTDFQQKKFN